MTEDTMAPAVAAVLATLVAAAFAPASVQAQEAEAPERPERTEVRMLRVGGPTAEGGWLGVRVEDLDAAAAEAAGLDAPRGARVTDVREGTPAAGAGLGEGDVIVRFDGEEVRSVAELVRLVRETPPGREVGLRIVREGETRRLTVEVGERPDRRLHGRAGPDWEEMANRFEHLEGELDEERMERIRQRIERARQRWEDRMEGAGDSLDLVAPRVRGMMARRDGPPRLGVRMQPLTDQLAGHFGVGDRGGVLVASVREGSAAAEAGLAAGDVIVRFADREVEDPGDLARAVHGAEAGPVSVTLVRDGDERTLTVELPERRSRTGLRYDGDGDVGPSPPPSPSPLPVPTLPG